MLVCSGIFLITDCTCWLLCYRSSFLYWTYMCHHTLLPFTLHQADRCKSKIMRTQRSSEEEEAHQPVPLPPPTGGHATLSEEEEERLVQEIVLRQLKPNGTYGKNCARMCQDLMQKGVSLKSAGPLVQSVVHRCVGVDWRSSASLSTRIPSSYWPSAFPSWTPQSSGPLLAGPPFW